MTAQAAEMLSIGSDWASPALDIDAVNPVGIRGPACFAMCLRAHHGGGVSNICQSVISDQPSEERCTLNYETQGRSRPDTGFIGA